MIQHKNRKKVDRPRGQIKVCPYCGRPYKGLACAHCFMAQPHRGQGSGFWFYVVPTNPRGMDVQVLDENNDDAVIVPRLQVLPLNNMRNERIDIVVAEAAGFNFDDLEDSGIDGGSLRFNVIPGTEARKAVLPSNLHWPKYLKIASVYSAPFTSSVLSENIVNFAYEHRVSGSDSPTWIGADVEAVVPDMKVQVQENRYYTYNAGGFIGRKDVEDR